MLLGAHLLVAAVVEPGQNERRVWLPGSEGWYEWATGRYFKAGQHVSLAAALDGPPPLLAREGCAIAMNDGEIHFDKVEARRGFQVFPFQGEGTFEATCFEDDGHSQACRNGGHGQWRLQVACTAQSLKIAVFREGRRAPVQDQLVLRLPAGEQRGVDFSGATLVTDSLQAGWRQLTLKLA